jgi:hypothetical protein
LTGAAAQRALDIASRHGFLDYVGVAHANLSWVALQIGEDVEAAAAQALAAWNQLPSGYSYPLQWLVRMPLAVDMTRRGHVDDALHQFELLLDKSQHLLPGPLARTIELALAKRARNNAADEQDVRDIIELAEDLGYV